MDTDSDKRRLGENVRAARQRNGISQRQLALMVGTSQSYLWRIESGDADVGIGVLCRIARALDVRVRDLVDF